MDYIVFNNIINFAESAKIFSIMNQTNNVNYPNTTCKSTKVFKPSLQTKSNDTNKKIFSRKPSNNNLNSNKLFINKNKFNNSNTIIEDQSNSIKQNQQNSIQLSIQKQKNPRLLSRSKNSSLQKILKVKSYVQLPLWKNERSISKQLQQKQGLIEQSLKNIMKKSHLSGCSKNYQHSNSQSNTTIPHKSIQKHTACNIFDDEESTHIQENENEKFSHEMVISTEFSSCENIVNDQHYAEITNKKIILPKQTNSKTYSRTSFMLPKQTRTDYKLSRCQQCEQTNPKIKQLNDTVRSLQHQLSKKQFQITKLNKKVIELQTFHTNLQYEIKILKQRQFLLNVQKQNLIQNYKSLQECYKQISEQIKYKSLQNSINKIYKEKNIKLQKENEMMKGQVERLKSKLKNKIKQFMESELVSIVNKCKQKNNQKNNQIKNHSHNQHNQVSPLVQNNKIKVYRYGYNNISKNQQSNTLLNAQKKSSRVQPKLSRVYSEDSIFSLTSEFSDSQE